MTAVETSGLVKRYPLPRRYRELLRRPFDRPTLTALAGIDLRVPAGRVFFLLGPNGAGKTTLIKVLTTLVLPDEGRASVLGVDVEREPGRVKAAIGLAAGDERSFYWRLTVGQNLEFFAALTGLRGGDRDRRIREVLALTGLAAAAGLRFHALSTGMRQMASLARALLPDPRVLFVDEPTRSLDPKAADSIRGFLRREMAEAHGRTVVWASHDLAEAADFGHDVAIIDRGRVRAAGPVAELAPSGARGLRDVYLRAVAAAAGEAS